MESSWLPISELMSQQSSTCTQNCVSLWTRQIWCLCAKWQSSWRPLRTFLIGLATSANFCFTTEWTRKYFIKWRMLNWFYWQISWTDLICNRHSLAVMGVLPHICQHSSYTLMTLINKGKKSTISDKYSSQVKTLCQKGQCYFLMRTLSDQIGHLGSSCDGRICSQWATN